MLAAVSKGMWAGKKTLICSNKSLQVFTANIGSHVQWPWNAACWWHCTNL